MKNIEVTLKTIRPASEAEKMEIAKKEWQNEHMQEFELANYDYYILKDGYILELRKPSKWTISKTLYYNDEYDAPEITLENFINYNKMNQEGTRWQEDYIKAKKELETTGSASGRWDYTGIWLYPSSCVNSLKAGICGEYDHNYMKFLRYLTQEEAQDYFNIIESYKNFYNERLKKYFKKYQDKIWAYGYWANR